MQTDIPTNVIEFMRDTVRRFDAGLPATQPPVVAPPAPDQTGGRIIDVDWANPERIHVPMGVSDVIAIRFTTGSVMTPTNLPKIVAAEYQSNPSMRFCTLSLKPYDFTTPIGPQYAASTITAPFSVGPNTTYYYPALLPNTTYYLNIKNGADADPKSAFQTSAAASGVADMYVDFLKPGGV